LEKARRCGESPHFKSVGAQQTRDSLDHTRLVIQKVNHAVRVAHDAASAMTGSSIRRVTPRPLLGSAQSRPSCAAMIDRQMDNPMPRPWLFVVKNGSKIWLESLFGK